MESTTVRWAARSRIAVSKDPVASSMATVFFKPPPAARMALPAVGTTYTAAITCSAASTASTTDGFMPAAERGST